MQIGDAVAWLAMFRLVSVGEGRQPAAIGKRHVLGLLPPQALDRLVDLLVDAGIEVEVEGEVAVGDKAPQLDRECFIDAAGAGPGGDVFVRVRLVEPERAAEHSARIQGAAPTG